MSLVETILLGAVQGLTEFIPVSSSGHLVLVQSLFSKNIDHLFIQALDFGTTLALIIYFSPKLKDMYIRVTKHKDFRLARNILITCIPAGLLGLLMSDFIEKSKILVSPLVVALMLISVGILMIIVDKLPRKSPKTEGSDLSPMRALVIGLAQMFALIPGVSRSGSTIIASRVMGLNSRSAAEYSFMVSIPIMLGLITKLLIKPSDKAYLASNFDTILIANIAAFISAIIAIRFMLNYLSKHGLQVFGWYRVALGVLVLAVLLIQYKI